jgi:hydroxymethylbilane synthase
LKKLGDHEYDAIVLAEAGLLRLQMTAVKRTRLSLDEMLPAPGQGALGIEVRSDDDAAREIVGLLDHTETRAAVTAERTLLANLHGGCLAPIAAYSVVVADSLEMKALVSSTDGTKSLFAEATTPFSIQTAAESGATLGKTVAGQLIKEGARELIAQAR